MSQEVPRFEVRTDDPGAHLQNLSFLYSTDFQSRYPSGLTKAQIVRGLQALDPSPFIEVVKAIYPLEFKIFAQLGIEPAGQPFDYTSLRKFNNPWGAGNKIVEENFSNIGSHILAVHLTALILALEHYDKNMIEARDVLEIGRRALMHDACKVYNIFLIRARAQNFITREQYFDESNDDCVIQELLNQGICDDDAQRMVRDYGIETAGTAECLRRFAFVTDAGIPVVAPGELDLKIVHVSDNITASLPAVSGEPAVSYTLTTEERMFYADAHKKASWGWIEGLGVNAKGEFAEVGDIHNPPADTSHVLSLHGYIAWTSNKINQEFCRNLGLASSKQGADAAIKDFVNQRLQSLSPEDYYSTLSRLRALANVL